MKAANGSTFSRSADDGNTPHQQEFKANFLSQIFICWMCPVFFKGNKRDLEEEDLIAPPKQYYSEVLGEKLER